MHGGSLEPIGFVALIYLAPIYNQDTVAPREVNLKMETHECGLPCLG
jgi:hypothetical protein